MLYGRKKPGIKKAHFLMIGVIVGILLLIIVFISSARSDMAQAEIELADTTNYISKQCASYRSLGLASETKSLMRIIECSQQIGRNLQSETEKDTAMEEELLERYSGELYLTGIILLDEEGQILARYTNEDEDQECLEDTLRKTVLLDTAQYLHKTYATRIDCADGSYIDLAATGRTDTDGVVVAYYHTPIEYVNSYNLSFQSILSGYSIESESTIVVTQGSTIVASNDESLEGRDSNEIAALRNINQKARNGEMIHADSEMSGIHHSFGMVERGRDYYVYVYIPERAVFASTPRKLLTTLIGYVFVLFLIQMIYWRTNQAYRDAQMQQERAYQETLKEAARKAESANIAKTEFLQRMSHDIRTPINGIRGMIEIAGHYKDDMQKQEECRKKVWEASGLLLELVNEVLDMGKLESGEIVLESRSFQVLDLLEEVLGIMDKQAAERGIEIICEKPEIQHTRLIGSPLHVKRLLMNIISNAVKYNKAKGKIRLSCKEIRSDENTAWFEFVCEDTGIGMSPEFQKRLFEPFTQESNDARSTYAGTGLGMAITKSLLDAMNGTITFRSEKNIGTTYYVTIPFQIDNTEEKKEVREQVPEEDLLKGTQILLAEDNELNMEIAEFLLENAGACVTKAYNGQEAVQLFERSEVGEYDAIMMDVMMPLMDGCQAAHTIREMDRPDAKTVPILAMTANAFDDDRKKSYEAGMNEHLTKPLETDKVLRILAEYCHREKTDRE